ncbi:Hypothetical predicted protein [Cloeon dipterum]|uniref:Uncharacterized protein n=1 Tax=Cloeon dipterum TaxID=197152 RepID=A0A8S1DUB6_9INSE|nr:Hypothetical predicted protein [Cloeon dipterum]
MSRTRISKSLWRERENERGRVKSVAIIITRWNAGAVGRAGLLLLPPPLLTRVARRTAAERRDLPQSGRYQTENTPIIISGHRQMPAEKDDSASPMQRQMGSQFAKRECEGRSLRDKTTPHEGLGLLLLPRGPE